MKPLIDFLKRHSLVIGLVLMFLYTWTIDLSYSGVLPFQFPFVIFVTLGWGFIFVSLLMTGLTQGKDAVVALLKRFLIWRVGWKWYFAAFLLLPAMQFASVLFTAVLKDTPMDFTNVMATKILGQSANLLVLFVPWFLYEIVANGEEMGWRGYVLPRLQTRYSALVSSLIVGVLWGLWHLPKFLGTSASSERSFGWFVAAHVALAVLYTWLYNNTRGSLLLATVFHASGNTAGMFLPVSFAAAGGLASNIMIVLYILAAVVVTIVAGTEHLSRKETRQVDWK